MCSVLIGRSYLHCSLIIVVKKCYAVLANFDMGLLQVIIVIFVIIVGSFEVDVSNWSPFAPNGFKAVLTGATVAFFAFVGFDAVANSAEESKRPQVSFSEMDLMVTELQLF